MKTTIQPTHNCISTRLEELTERDVSFHWRGWGWIAIIWCDFDRGFIYKLSLILEDFEDGPDHVEHSQRKVEVFSNVHLFSLTTQLSPW